MTPAAGLETPEVLAQLGAASAVACVYTFICHACLPRREFHGSPLYNWLSCLPIQLVGFPVVVSLAVAVLVGNVIAFAGCAAAEDRADARNRRQVDPASGGGSLR